MKKPLSLKKKSTSDESESKLTLKRPLLKSKKTKLTVNKSKSRNSKLMLNKTGLNPRKSKLSLSDALKAAKKKSEPAKKVPKKPKPKPKPKKKKIPQPPEEPVLNKALRLDKILAETYPMWADSLPLSLGMADVLIAAYRDKHTVKSIKLVVNLHVSTIKYLQNIIDEDCRFDLNGEKSQKIIQKHKEHAQRKILRLTKEAEEAAENEAKAKEEGETEDTPENATDAKADNDTETKTETKADD